MNAPAPPRRKPWLNVVIVVAAFGSIGVPLLLRAFLLEAFQIPSGAMIPTLQIGDHIFVNKTVSRPARGDVIVFRYPLSPDISYVKRVIGMPGDTIDIRKGTLVVNGKEVPRRDLGEADELEGRKTHAWEEHVGNHTFNILHDPDRSSDFEPVQVPPDSYFVMGDNRENSNDSRVWGTVPAQNIQGRVAIVWWSSDPAPGGQVRWNRLGHRVE